MYYCKLIFIIGIIQIRDYSKRISFLLILSSTPFLGACSVNPATGNQSFTGLMSTNDEIRIGRKEHPKILKAFGGRYNDNRVQTYVNKIGNHLAKKSELPNIKWTFTVLNSPLVNALALPGGYIYVTRGLMALASNEAELAGVIAHEIGHVTARHTAQRYSSSMLAGGLSMATSILLGSTAGEIANFAGKAVTQSYSRSQEFEADTLGVRYLSRSRYNTKSMATFLKKLRAYSQLQAKLHQKDPASVDYTDMFATHPRTLDRVERAIVNTRNTRPKSRMGTIDYMEQLHNIIYGDSPKEGLIKGQTFIHPKLRFRFDVPEGFRLFNSARLVIAKGPNDSLIKFDIAQKSYSGPMTHYIQNVWARNTNFYTVDQINVNGMPGVTTTKRIRRRNGRFDLRLVAIRYNNSRIYRFLFTTKASHTQQLAQKLRETTYSLQNISHAEAKGVSPNRILVKPVGAEDTVESFSRQMRVNDLKEETFRVINGLKSNQNLRRGQLIKVISEK